MRLTIVQEQWETQEQALERVIRDNNIKNIEEYQVRFVPGDAPRKPKPKRYMNEFRKRYG